MKLHSFLINTFWGSPLIHSITNTGWLCCQGSSSDTSSANPAGFGVGFARMQEHCTKRYRYLFENEVSALVTPSRLALPSLAHVPGPCVWTQNSALAIRGYLRWSLSLLGGSFSNWASCLLTALHPACRKTSCRVSFFSFTQFASIMSISCRLY